MYINSVSGNKKIKSKTNWLLIIILDWNENEEHIHVSIVIGDNYSKDKYQTQDTKEDISLSLVSFGDAKAKNIK